MNCNVTRSIACLFNIVYATDGWITLIGEVDYETRSSYSLTVRACVPTNTSCTEDSVVNIVITNVNEPPQFTPNVSSMSIPEELVSTCFRLYVCHIFLLLTPLYTYMYNILV